MFATATFAPDTWRKLANPLDVMPKLLAVWLCLVLWSISSGASEQHAALIKIDLDDVRPFILQTNGQLGTRLDAKIFSDYARSIAVGNVFSEPLDVEYRGIVFTITYRIRKEDPDSIYLYFFSSNRAFIGDIRTQMKVFSEAPDHDT